MFYIPIPIPISPSPLCRSNGVQLRAGLANHSAQLPPRQIPSRHVWSCTQTRDYGKPKKIRKELKEDNIAKVTQWPPTSPTESGLAINESTLGASFNPAVPRIPPRPGLSLPSYVERLKQFKNGWTALHRANMLMIGFATVLSGIWTAFSLEENIRLRRV